MNNNLKNDVSVYDIKTNKHCVSNLDQLHDFIERETVEMIHMSEDLYESTETLLRIQTVLSWLPLITTVRLDRTDMRHQITEFEFSNGRTISLKTHLESALYNYYFNR